MNILIFIVFLLIFYDDFCKRVRSHALLPSKLLLIGLMVTWNKSKLLV